MTKLQRKRRAARERRTNRRYDLAALSHHFAALQQQIVSVESSAYHSKRPRWLYCHGRKGQEQSFVRDTDRIDRADPNSLGNRRRAALETA